MNTRAIREIVVGQSHRLLVDKRQRQAFPPGEEIDSRPRQHRACKRRVNLPPQELRSALKRNHVEELAIAHDHAEYAANLEWEHRDPWDRLLLAQALLEKCVLVSVDSIFDQVAVDRHW